MRPFPRGAESHATRFPDLGRTGRRGRPHVPTSRFGRWPRRCTVRPKVIRSSWARSFVSCRRRAACCTATIRRRSTLPSHPLMRSEARQASRAGLGRLAPPDPPPGLDALQERLTRRHGGSPLQRGGMGKSRTHTGRRCATEDACRARRSVPPLQQRLRVRRWQPARAGVPVTSAGGLVLALLVLAGVAGLSIAQRRRRTPH
jgi:hypothetical protein